MDYHGDNGYFLWLVFGSFALLAPLKHASFRERVLRGRDRLYLLAGFEEIFTCLATVTREGLRYESPSPSMTGPDPMTDGLLD